MLDKREKEANACKLAKEMLWHICHRFRFILIWNKRWMALTFITTSDIIVNASMAFSFSSPSFLSGFLWISHQQEKNEERRRRWSCCRPSQYSHHSQKKSPSWLLVLLLAASISINQQRHGKGISTFAVQKPWAAASYRVCTQEATTLMLLPKSGHIICIPDFYFITLNIVNKTHADGH